LVRRETERGAGGFFLGFRQRFRLYPSEVEAVVERERERARVPAPPDGRPIQGRMLADAQCALEEAMAARSERSGGRGAAPRVPSGVRAFLSRGP
jgi:hypothetical protein